ncbi:hypothetical protein [Pseudomonas sp. JG-B]|uniref:hypothetical protein n=1 Tax=Pseudomonas sp. JG-B TaxID=2603214 RepID=UPI00129DF01A|nr:hypothetical protein [Pseudomonas sp. JG-B]MRK19105.1 hypothetical protein [Pseudomonas sp. JG-B]
MHNDETAMKAATEAIRVFISAPVISSEGGAFVTHDDFRAKSSDDQAQHVDRFNQVRHLDVSAE